MLLKNAPRSEYGPVELEDGWEVREWTATPVSATGCISIGGEFRPSLTPIAPLSVDSRGDS